MDEEITEEVVVEEEIIAENETLVESTEVRMNIAIQGNNPLAR